MPERGAFDNKICVRNCLGRLILPRAFWRAAMNTPANGPRFEILYNGSIHPECL